MTAEEIELCSTLAGIYFGPDFKDFVSIIGGNDFLTLFHIKQRITSFAGKVQLAQRLERVEHVLTLFLRHRIIESRTANGVTQYRLVLQNIRIFLSFPRFKFFVIELFGKLGAAILEFLLERGQCQAYEIIEELAPCITMYEDLTFPVPNDATDEEIQRHQYEAASIRIRDCFSLMVANSFISKEPILVGSREFVEPGEKRFEVYFKNPAVDKIAGNPDYWSLDLVRLKQFTTDQLLVDYTRHKCGAEAANVMRHILRLQNYSRDVLCYEYSVTQAEIQRICADAGDQTDHGLDGKLDLLIRFQFLEKNGTMLSVLIFDQVERMVQQVVLQWIAAKYGTDARKIMALLFEGNYLEPKNVAKKCVMDEKDANQILYRLMNDGLASFQDMTPAGNFFPYYCTYLFNCNKVKVIQHARKAALNAQNKLTLRRRLEFDKVKDLIKKKKTIEDYKAAHPEENLEDALLPREEREVESYHRMEEMLLQRLNSLEQQIILSEAYIAMKRKKLKEECSTKGWDPVHKLAAKKKKAA